MSPSHAEWALKEIETGLDCPYPYLRISLLTFLWFTNTIGVAYSNSVLAFPPPTSEGIEGIGGYWWAGVIERV